MMRRAEGAMPDQWRTGRELIGDGINARHIQRFLDAHFRQNAGQGASQ